MKKLLLLSVLFFMGSCSMLEQNYYDAVSGKGLYLYDTLEAEFSEDGKILAFVSDPDNQYGLELIIAGMTGTYKNLDGEFITVLLVENNTRASLTKDTTYMAVYDIK